MELSSGKILLVDGPAFLKVLEGSTSIFNCSLKANKEYFLRPWKRYPVYAETDSRLMLRMGEDSRVSFAEEDECVGSWFDQVKSLAEFGVVGVLGGVDVGKTAFTTLAANTLSKIFGKTVVLSLDPGQTCFTPPTVVGAAEMNGCVHDLSELKPFWQRPVGSASAVHAAAEVLEAVEEFSRVMPSEVPTVVDMDGWVDDAAAAAHKAAVLKTLGCRAAVIIGSGLERLHQLLESDGVKVVRLAQSKYVKTRDTAERRKIREWVFRKFIGKPTLRLIPSSWVQLSVLGHPGQKPLDYLNTALKQLADSAAEDLSNLCKSRTGLIAYLYDERSYYLGLGIMCGYDNVKSVIKIIASVESGFSKVQLGRLLLTAEGEEKLVLN
ncbi:MAG: polynucleotide 5'-hydroxyl-kinase [Candidatus Caldarchaeum sp.]|nr:polynucleotide 5'-hydroxyl-kinase [Candidatus Caldarchaeum sp.]